MQIKLQCKYMKIVSERLSESKRKDNLHQKRKLFTKPNPIYLFLSSLQRYAIFCFPANLLQIKYTSSIKEIVEAMEELLLYDFLYTTTVNECPKMPLPDSLKNVS